MAEAHLHGGHDVVIPQYVGRPEFVEVLEDTAWRCGARFAEVLLEAPAVVAVERFHAHRRELIARGEDHPQVEAPDDEVEATIDDARLRLANRAAARDDIIRLRADQGLDDMYAELMAEIDEVRC